MKREVLKLKKVSGEKPESAFKPTWYVWRKRTIPKRKHRSLEAAEREAQRLSRAFPGQRFRVLYEISRFKIPSKPPTPKGTKAT